MVVVAGAYFFSGLAKLPLAHQPGEVWDYGISVDVLSRVVEVASGQPFDQFLETRLFRPLGMVDTGFYVPEAKLSRLVDPPAGGRGGPPDSVLADVNYHAVCIPFPRIARIFFCNVQPGRLRSATDD